MVCNKGSAGRLLSSANKDEILRKFIMLSWVSVETYSLMSSRYNYYLNLQNHYDVGEAEVRAAFSKLYDDIQEAFRKLEE